MKWMRMLLAAMMVLGVAFGTVGCAEEEGPAEEAGEAIDEAAEDMGDAMEDLGENIEERAEEANPDN